MAAVVMAGTLAACGGGGSSGGGGGDNANIDRSDGLPWDTVNQMYVLEDVIMSGAEHLTLWVDNAGLGDYVVEAYQSIYPDVRIEVSVVGHTDSRRMMQIQGEAGTGADVFLMISDHFGQAMNSAVINEMGKYEEQIRARAPEGAWGAAQYDGRLWGIPTHIETIALFYNKTLLEKLHAEGVIASPEPATDFNQIIELAAKYSRPADSVWTMRFPPRDSYFSYVYLTAHGYELYGSNRTDPSMPNLNTQPVIDGLHYFRTLRPTFDIAAGDANWDFTVIEFRNGETPYLVCGPWGLSEAREGAAENGFEFGVVPLPAVNGKFGRSFSGTQLACVSSYTKYPAAARNLAMFLASDEILNYFFREMGKIPALKDELIPRIAGLAEDTNTFAFLNQTQRSDAMPSFPDMDSWWKVAERMFEAVWEGLMSPEDAAAKAQDDYDELRRLAGQ